MNQASSPRSSAVEHSLGKRVVRFRAQQAYYRFSPQNQSVIMVASTTVGPFDGVRLGGIWGECASTRRKFGAVG